MKKTSTLWADIFISANLYFFIAFHTNRISFFSFFRFFISYYISSTYNNSFNSIKKSYHLPATQRLLGFFAFILQIQPHPLIHPSFLKKELSFVSGFKYFLESHLSPNSVSRAIAHFLHISILSSINFSIRVYIL